MYAYSGAANVAGIHRFGYRAMIRDTMWLVDQNYNVAESPNMSQELSDLIANLTTRLATFYTPLPAMEGGQVTFRLSPDNFVGMTFTYHPFRGDGPWTFYINAVQHNWKFGGPSITTLGLERGLPQDLYQNSASMQQILAGNAQRLNGYIVPDSHPTLAQPFKRWLKSGFYYYSPRSNSSDYKVAALSDRIDNQKLMRLIA